MPRAALATLIIAFAVTAGSSSSAAQSSADGPLARAVPRAAAMLAASDNAASDGRSVVAPVRPDTADWIRLQALEPGTALIVQLKGAPPVRRFLVHWDWETLTTAERWGNAGPSGTVFRAPKADVAEVSALRKHRTKHALRGALIGAAVGTLYLGVSAAAKDPCEGEYCGVAGWASLGGLAGAMFGTPVGLFVGAVAPRSPDLVYRAAN